MRTFICPKCNTGSHIRRLRISDGHWHLMCKNPACFRNEFRVPIELPEGELKNLRNVEVRDDDS